MSEKKEFSRIREFEIFKAGLRKELADHKAALRRELEDHKAQMDQTAEEWRMEHDRQARERRITIDQELTRMTTNHRAIIDFAVIAVRSLVLVNGGALVAALALLGQLTAKGDNVSKALVVAVQNSLGQFLIGLACGVGAAMLAYVTQVLAYELGEKRGWMEFVRAITMITAVISLFFFVRGAYVAASGI